MPNELSTLLRRYRDLNLQDVLDHERFNEYSIVHHSTSIEGSTLTEVETRLLLEEDITPKGKPLTHSLMVKDHYNALRYVLDAAVAKKAITVEFIQQINALVMKNTGSVYNTALGEIDASKGMFRKGNVSAGGSYFLTFDKVVPYTTALAKGLNETFLNAKSEEEQLRISFSAHFDLVSIHPFYDGNGRTSRLLMNYIQACHGLPLAIVFKEDKADYYVALQDTRKQEDKEIFYAFMFGQYKKHLEQEIASYTQAMTSKPSPKKDKGNGYSLFF
ncbi:Fic family protein [Pseudoflavitalea sp. X16]|nr:Fic family protein [Paraflavitalea devenefica]